MKVCLQTGYAVPKSDTDLFCFCLHSDNGVRTGLDEGNIAKFMVVVDPPRKVADEQEQFCLSGKLQHIFPLSRTSLIMVPRFRNSTK